MNGKGDNEKDRRRNNRESKKYKVADRWNEKAKREVQKTQDTSEKDKRAGERLRPKESRRGGQRERV